MAFSVTEFSSGNNVHLLSCVRFQVGISNVGGPSRFVNVLDPIVTP